jgi:hypothetical protein
VDKLRAKTASEKSLLGIDLTSVQMIQRVNAQYPCMLQDEFNPIINPRSTTAAMMLPSAYERNRLESKISPALIQFHL